MFPSHLSVSFSSADIARTPEGDASSSAARIPNVDVSRERLFTTKLCFNVRRPRGRVEEELLILNDPKRDHRFFLGQRVSPFFSLRIIARSDYAAPKYVARVPPCTRS